MWATTKNAAYGEASARPAGVEKRRSAASSIRDDICCLVSVPGIPAFHDATRPLRFEDARQPPEPNPAAGS